MAARPEDLEAAAHLNANTFSSHCQALGQVLAGFAEQHANYDQMVAKVVPECMLAGWH